MNRAAVLLRSGPHYKAGVFSEGLRRHGYCPEVKWQRNPHPSDLLLLWNRTRGNEPIAEIYERAGARVVVAENGFTRPETGKHYALFLGHHNGVGSWFVGDRVRHPISEQPWRERGDHVLVLPQRGIGELSVAMPSAWGFNVMQRLRAMTDRPLVFRKHPGHIKNGDPDTLEHDLAGAHCAVTWGSSAGIKALQAGVPVFHCLADWIGAPAAAPLDRSIEDCHTPDRELLWTRISWAQWTADEIGSGDAFDQLLNSPRGDLFCARQQSVDDHRQGDGTGRQPAGARMAAQVVA